MFTKENRYLTGLQDAFISKHGKKKYTHFVRLLRFADTDRICREFFLSCHEVLLWRQVVSLQDCHDAFCRKPSIWG